MSPQHFTDKEKKGLFLARSFPNFSVFPHCQYIMLWDVLVIPSCFDNRINPNRLRLQLSSSIFSFLSLHLSLGSPVFFFLSVLLLRHLSFSLPPSPLCRLLNRSVLHHDLKWPRLMYNSLLTISRL